MARKEKPLEYGVLNDSTTKQGAFLRRENQGKTGNCVPHPKTFRLFHGHLGKLLVSVQVDTVANEASFSAFSTPKCCRAYLQKK